MNLWCFGTSLEVFQNKARIIWTSTFGEVAIKWGLKFFIFFLPLRFGASSMALRISFCDYDAHISPVVLQVCKILPAVQVHLAFLLNILGLGLE